MRGPGSASDSKQLKDSLATRDQISTTVHHTKVYAHLIYSIRYTNLRIEFYTLALSAPWTWLPKNMQGDRK